MHYIPIGGGSKDPNHYIFGYGLLIEDESRESTTKDALYAFPARVKGMESIGLAAEAPGRTVRAEVVALDQPFMFNRLGSAMPQGMIFALRSDIVAIDPLQGIVPRNVRLWPDKRPRSDPASGERW